MNFLLIDPFIKNSLPEDIEFELSEDGLAKCAAFNSKGNLLAVGCSDGRVVVWDFYTRQLVKILIGHVMTITSIAWTHSGKKLLTTSLDARVKFWDLLTSNVDVSLTLNSQIISACLDSKVCIACPLYNSPVIIDLIEHKISPIPSVKDVMYDGNFSSPVYTTAVFYNQIKIFTGNSHGIFTIYDLENCEIEYSKKITTSCIKHMIFSNDKKRLLFNCKDNVIRGYEVGVWDSPIFELNDAVNRFSWKAVCFTSNDDYIVAASAEKHEHKIYIWNNSKNTNPPIASILEGPMEGVLDLIWHPLGSNFLSISSSGKVYVWRTYVPERWSAFNSEFTDLKYNIEYIEKEDEFDTFNEQEIDCLDMLLNSVDDEESELLDIVTIEEADLKNNDFYLPVSVIPDKLV